MHYDFRCLKCKQEYDAFAAYDKTGKYKKVKCPACNSAKKELLLGASNFNFTNPVGTDRWTSYDKGQDYRYKYIQPDLAKQRKMAENASHMGTNPYGNIDDISSGDNFGPVQ